MPNALQFANPTALYLLFALPVLAALLYLAHRLRNRRLARLAAPETRAVILPGQRPRVAFWRGLLCLLALAAAIGALARPQWGFAYEVQRRVGLDIVFAVDVSNSMRAADIRPTRYQKAQLALANFTTRLAGDRVGLVAFAGASILRCPLTDDYSFFRLSLNDIRPGSILLGGTDIAAALRTAADSFDPDRTADRVIVLITDGEDHEGELDPVIESLVDANITLFTIGVGSPAGKLIEIDGNYVTDSNGNIVKSALQEDLLRDLALRTGGFYLRARPSEFGLDRIAEEGLADRERQDTEGDRMRVPIERFQWFLGLCLLALAAEVFITHRQPKTGI